jgi:hypothetical protein
MATKQKPNTKTRDGARAVVRQEPADVPVHLRAASGGSRGSENVEQGDIVIPRIEIVQDLSGYVKKNDPLFNPQAEAGMLVNTVTGELFPARGVVIVPVMYLRQELLWVPRNKGGGFRGAYATKEEAKIAMEALDDEVDMVSTPQHICLMRRAGGRPDEVVVAMPKTKEKINRKLNTMVKMTESDRFARVYTLSTAQEKNQKGEFFNFQVAPAGYPNEAEYRLAEVLYEAISKGARKVNVQHEAADAAQANEEDGEDF